MTGRRKLRVGMIGGGGPVSFSGPPHRRAIVMDNSAELVAGALRSQPEPALAAARELYFQRGRSAPTCVFPAVIRQVTRRPLPTCTERWSGPSAAATVQTPPLPFDHPGIADGLAGMAFLHAAIDSASIGSQEVEVPRGA